ncbi:MAG: peptidoglycan DD-metalloendopeptidase family protein [Thiobacillaceae bacterium]
MRFAAVLLFGLLAGCETVTAPIYDATQPPAKHSAAKPAARPLPKPVIAQPASGATYTVQKGDTLFSIAFANGLDFRDLAAWNELPSPDLIKIGQVLKLTAPVSSSPTSPIPSLPASPVASLPTSTGVQTIPVKERTLEAKALPEIPVFTAPQAQRLPWSEANWARLNSESATLMAKVEPPKPAEKTPMAEAPKPPPVATVEPSSSIDGWLWPVSGALLARYGEGGGKGIDLAGNRGEPVFATAPGKVVYSGSGLRGYGQLIIIKHANEYLSAYAHNQKVVVHEGEQVTAGEKIAEMGDSDADRVKLHFEIRQFGKPIDPLKLLPNRS